MKKILILLALMASVACNDEEKSTKKSAIYEGKLTVISNTDPTAPQFLLHDVKYELTEGDNKLLNLTMHEIRFASTMPMSLTIVIPQLRLEDLDGDGVFSLISTADPIVPYIGGTPYEKFEIPEFTATLTDDKTKLNVSFTCKNPQIPVGGETLNHNASFTGTLVK